MRWVARFLATACLAIVACPSATAADVKPRVTFELLTKPGLALTAAQDWYKLLGELGISGLQIHPATARDKADIKKLGTAAAPAYQVVGILAADNVLYLPGGRFTLKDSGRLRKWINDLGDQGAEGVTQPRAAFGLIPRQLEEVMADLKRPVTASTKGTSADKAFDEIGGKLKAPLVVNAAARRALTEVTMAEELRGIASGTALAIALRPAGLVLVPERPSGGQLQYRVSAVQAGQESWPIGFKPETRPDKLVPDLLTFLNVEIQEISVAEALAAIEGRLKIPFLFDRNALAQHGADPANVQADVPAKRMTYSQALRRILAQAKLKYDLRVDEAEKPFLWITTIKESG